MDRKATARQTLAIMEQGAYQYEGRTIDLHSELEEAVRSSFLITPQQAEELLEAYSECGGTAKVLTCAENISTVDAIRRLTEEGKALPIPEFCKRQKSGRRIYQWRDGAGGESGGI